MDRFDTIVTLGHDVNPDGSLSGELEARVTRSIAVFREGRAPTIAMSGGRAPGEPLPAAIAMKRFALAVPSAPGVAGVRVWEVMSR